MLFAVKEPMGLQYRACPRWALLGAIQHGAHEAFLVLDPLIKKSEAVAILQHVLSRVLKDPDLWQHEEPVALSSRLFG
jgi:hypothetical protein